MPMLDHVSEMPMPSRPYMAASDNAEVTTNQSTPLLLRLDRLRIGGLRLGMAHQQRVADVLLQLAGVHAEHAIDATLDEAQVLLRDDHRAVADVDLAQGRDHAARDDRCQSQGRLVDE